MTDEVTDDKPAAAEPVPMEGPVGGWIINCSLKDPRDQSKVINPDTVVALIQLWTGMRERRKEPLLKDIRARKGSLNGPDDPILTLFGLSEHDFKATFAMLTELMDAIRIPLGHRLIEAFVAGVKINYVSKMEKVPPGVTIN